MTTRSPTSPLRIRGPNSSAEDLPEDSSGTPIDHSPFLVLSLPSSRPSTPQDGSEWEMLVFNPSPDYKVPSPPYSQTQLVRPISVPTSHHSRVQSTPAATGPNLHSQVASNLSKHEDIPTSRKPPQLSLSGCSLKEVNDRLLEHLSKSQPTNSTSIPSIRTKSRSFHHERASTQPVPHMETVEEDAADEPAGELSFDISMESPSKAVVRVSPGLTAQEAFILEGVVSLDSSCHASEASSPNLIPVGMIPAQQAIHSKTTTTSTIASAESRGTASRATSTIVSDKPTTSTVQTTINPLLRPICVRQPCLTPLYAMPSRPFPLFNIPVSHQAPRNNNLRPIPNAFGEQRTDHPKPGRDKSVREKTQMDEKCHKKERHRKRVEEGRSKRTEVERTERSERERNPGTEERQITSPASRSTWALAPGLSLYGDLSNATSTSLYSVLSISILAAAGYVYGRPLPAAPAPRRRRGTRRSHRSRPRNVLDPKEVEVDDPLVGQIIS